MVFTLISSKIINTKYQMFWNKKRMMNSTWGKQAHLRYRKGPDPSAVFHYLVRPQGAQVQSLV